MREREEKVLGGTPGRVSSACATVKGSPPGSLGSSANNSNRLVRSARGLGASTGTQKPVSPKRQNRTE